MNDFHEIPHGGSDDGHSSGETQRSIAIVAKPSRESGGQRASRHAMPRATPPAGNNPREGNGGDPQKRDTLSSAVAPDEITIPERGSSRARLAPTPTLATPGCAESPQGDGTGQTATGHQFRLARSDRPASNGGCDDGQSRADTHGGVAIVANNPRATGDGAGRSQVDTQTRTASPNQFADPLIAQIVELRRQRDDMVRAQMRLTLQMKAICRRMVSADERPDGLMTAKQIARANGLLKAVIDDTDHDLASPMLRATLGALAGAQAPLIQHRAVLDKALTKLGKQLPIAHMADQIKGINHATLATIVGELGDLSAYERGVAGIWKRAGLAVIDGERQRKCADAAKALAHGYNPRRRSTFYLIAECMIKAQGTGDAAGPYRQVYDAHKAYQAETHPDAPKAQHHARALRYMTKRLLKDLWREWRHVRGMGEKIYSQTPTICAMQAA